MEFKSQYLTYPEYRQLGGKLEEVPFNLLEIKARGKVDERTLGRLKNLSSQITEVKACILRLIEVMDNNEKKSSKNIASESTDGYSITYGNSSTSKENAKQYDDIIRSYLLTCKLEDGTPYLYCGVR